MTATSGKQLAVGLRYAVVIELNADGTPKGNVTPATGSDGLAYSGPKAFTLNVPEARKITHVGKDRPLAVDFLPPTEALDGELAVSGSETAIVALLGGILAAAVGEAKLVALANSQQGFEPQVGLLLYQQSLDVILGTRRWRSFIFPSARCIYMPAGMSENAEDSRYKIAPAITTKQLWGTALSIANNGCLTMQGIEMMSEGRPNIAYWTGNGVETNFILPLDKPATSVAKMAIYVDGVLQVAQLSATLVTEFTFTAAPDNTAHTPSIVCVYEY